MWFFRKKQPIEPMDFDALDREVEAEQAAFRPPPSKAPQQASKPSRFISVEEGQRRMAALTAELGSIATRPLPAPHPLVHVFLKENPHTFQDALDLDVMHDNAVRAAEAEMQEDDVLRGTAHLTVLQRQMIVDRRARDLMWLEAHMADFERYDYRRLMAEDDRRADVGKKLDAIKAAVDRGAVAANLLDFAKEHPVIAAVAGRTMYKIIKSGSER